MPQTCPGHLLLGSRGGPGSQATMREEPSSSVMWGLCLEVSLRGDVGLMRQLPPKTESGLARM